MADVSLVILPGQAGGLLRNVNQWRAQLGLPKLDEAAFENTAQWVTTPVGLGAVIHLTGLAPGADPAFDGRTVTVVVELAMQTWFFKMRGNSELVAGQGEAFLNWVAGVRLAESEIPSPAPPHGIPPEPAPPVPVIQVPAGHEPTWKIPDGWVEGTDPPKRHATFAVPGPDGPKGEVSVVLLAGNGGEPLANVNRWHQQAGLPPIAAQDLAERVQSVWSSGTTMSIVQVAGPRCSTMAAWTSREEGTWFFKLTGPATVLDAERANFAGFLQSIKFPGQQSGFRPPSAKFAQFWATGAQPVTH
jgi:hypothetical protein